MIQILFIFILPSSSFKCDKAKKTLEFEFHDLEEKLTEAQSSCNRAHAERKKFEADAIAASDELHEVKFELKGAEEKVRVACRLGDTLRNEDT